VSRFAKRLFIVSGWVLLLSAIPALQVRAEDSDPTVQRGVAYLRSHASSVTGVGESAMMALAMIKAEVSPADPALAACISRITARFSGSGYLPERGNGPDVYEAAVVSMALANLDAEGHRAHLESLAQFLMGRQKANGSWDYQGRDKGDTSISQYAVLGLWEAENAGASVPGSVWDNAASWYMSSQSSAGSWNYHRDEGGPETLSMTAAGVGSLLICQRQLSRYRNKGDSSHPLLTALVAEGAPGRYDVSASAAKISDAIKRGFGWLGSNFNLSKNNPNIGRSVFYGLYGIERIGSLGDRETLGRVNWFKQGRAFLVSEQQSTGNWSQSFPDDNMNTAWAILFLTKSTAKTLRRIEIKRLGAGTLLGGRGLPKDLSSLTIAGGKVVSRPMNGAVEGMLAVLEDPRAAGETASSAVAGVVARYLAEGSEALRPHKDRFRKLLSDRDPGLRRVAAWSLGRTGDLDVAPALINALTDPDDDVVQTARQGLQLLSRKIESLGPPPNATPEQRQEAARKWRDWYDAIRPFDLEGLDDADVSAARRKKPQ